MQSLTGINPHARRALRRLRLQLDRLAVAPMTGTNRSLQRGQGLEFDQVVQYAYGDDVREIDWNVSARLGDIYRKSFIEDRQIKLVCVFADHPALQFGSRTTAKRDRLLEALSLLLMFAAEQQQTVSLMHLHGRSIEVLPFTRNCSRILRTITQLYTAAAPLVTERGPLAPPLEHLRRLGRGHLIIWFGEIPQIPPGADWLVLTRRHSTMAIRVEDPWERDAPDRELTTFDPVSQRLVEVPAAMDGAVLHGEWRRQRERLWSDWWPRSDQRLVIDNDADSDTFVAVSNFLGQRRQVVRMPVS